MTLYATLFVLINGLILLLVPRRWAPLPFLIGTCYMTLGQGFDLGPLTFTVVRMLVAIGFLRIIIRQEGLVGGMTSLDWTLILFGIWAVISSAFHAPPKDALVFRLGILYNVCGSYFLFRIFCQSFKDVLLLVCIIAILLAPVAVEMVLEVNTFYNYFSVLGGVSMYPHLREGEVRANGPFVHAILAGTVGAVSFPLMFTIWRSHRRFAVLGMLASLAIVVSANASGPYLCLIAGIGALFMWPFRAKTRLFRWLIVFVYIGLDIVMMAPPYFLMARVPIVQGSTGYHRAYLIEAALNHFWEWCFAGTDQTAHWMVTGVSWSNNHTDITNHYLQFGIIGGLPLMLLFIFALSRGFAFVGRMIKEDRLPKHSEFGVWTLGASLFAHTVVSVSVSFFDQSYIFLYITLAAIGSAWASLVSPQRQRDAALSPTFGNGKSLFPMGPTKSF